MVGGESGGVGLAEPMLHPTLGDADWPTFVTFSWRDKHFEQTDNGFLRHYPCVTLTSENVGVGTRFLGSPRLSRIFVRSVWVS